jgi:putative oxidoreductase
VFAFGFLERINFSSRWTLLPLRLVTGAGFLAHGVAKWNRGPAKFAMLLQRTGAPFPLQTAWLVTGLEVLGGAAMILGLLVTIVSIPLIVSMVVAIVTVQGHYGFSSVNTIGLTASGPLFGPPGYEINLLYMAGLLALALSGPSALSIDRLLTRGNRAVRRPR